MRVGEELRGVGSEQILRGSGPRWPFTGSVNVQVKALPLTAKRIGSSSGSV